MTRSSWLMLGLAALLAAAGLVGVTQARSGLNRTVTTVHGTPVELIVPASDAPAPRPGVIVVHGFSGSRQLMYGIAQTLARNGYAAAVVDLPGHGQNTSRLSVPQARNQGFDSALTYVMAWLRTVPGVDPEKLTTVGHSMGAGAVVRFGSRDADILATVAISGGGAARLPRRPDSPRNLLAVAGAWESANVRAACASAVTAAYPGATPGRRYGAWIDGTARQCRIVPGVEHLSVLFSRDTNAAVVRWLDESTGAFPRGRDIVMAIPMWPALALHAAGALGLLLLATALFPHGGTEPAPPWSHAVAFAGGLPRGAVVIVAVAPAILAALVMRVLPGGWLPLLTADYLCGFYAVTGVVTAAGVRQLGVPLTGGWSAGVICRSLLLSAAVILAFGAVAQFTWLNVSLTGPRVWLAGVVFPAWLVFFLAQDRLLRSRPAPEYFAWSAGSTIAVTLVLITAVFTLRAPPFLLLLVPAFVPLLIVHGWYGHWLRARTQSSIPAASMNAALFAWLMAAAFPLV